MQNQSVPNAFSNFAHQCVSHDKAASLFCVKVTTVAENHPQMLTHLIRVCHMTAEEAQAEITSSHFATAFVVGETETEYSILTCAHLLEKYYSAEYQLTDEQLENWFDVRAICNHYEQHRNAYIPNIHANPDVDTRNYTHASITRFDQGRDLMLLDIPKQFLYGTQNFVRCYMPHPALRLANGVPKRLDDVTMVSWPPCRDDTAVIGQVVKQSRHYGQITRDLSKGYTMMLMELDITGDCGSSGAPILNHHARVISMYHGRLNSVGYGVSTDDIWQFLAP
ncbi:hypothetical protein PR202_ga03170 [Eleusine coracana subsp. coracana]|uniref:Serine protease n=1 Tax=Eleusine coracana subsp. coracana TaxID=191504 RepID=A0AAV5BMQ7_ELECO|nr:hypothetical protein PR202_ga03170 [Eleusine coracana subsp. coracana]